ncbi:hypothetical protein GCK72_013084 [Caenorhabditis remanei]|uniref:Uncharacterized protein n=2 Tax=Caenorhabditis remanei TaxID=31234 RepID=A0A6A5GMZ9_CAERE|nr:hypothetical protein GCK72_013084 [Caenorhabditis remanei]KAF1756630.1 hypothetical protein GCK72_013084 [Caenorhabditis remanei]
MSGRGASQRGRPRNVKNLRGSEEERNKILNIEETPRRIIRNTRFGERGTKRPIQTFKQEDTFVNPRISTIQKKTKMPHPRNYLKKENVSYQDVDMSSNSAYQPYDIDNTFETVGEKNYAIMNSVNFAQQTPLGNFNNYSQLEPEYQYEMQETGALDEEEMDFNFDHTKMLEKAVQEQSVLNIGKAARQGISKGTISEVQLEEFCRNTRRPNIPLFGFFQESENSTSDEQASLRMGQMMIMKMSTTDVRKIESVQASLNSLSANFAKHTKVGYIKQQKMSREYETPGVEGFKGINLSRLYNTSTLIGNDALTQLTNFYQKVFKMFFHPSYTIWTYSFRPATVRLTDKHFREFPLQISDTLTEFGLDIAGLHLPQELLDGDISANHPFLQSLLIEDPVTEIKRRRREREKAIFTAVCAIGRTLKNLRAYHFDIEKSCLINCPNGKNCKDHLMWEQLKTVRLQNRNNGVSTNEADPREILSKFASMKNPSSTSPVASSSSSTVAHKH